MGVQVREKPNGSGIWWIFINHHGKRKSKRVGTNKIEVVRLAKIIEGRLAAGDLGMGDLEKKTVVKTIEEYAAIWLATTVPATLKPSTQSDYHCIVRKHISKASFYNYPVDEITKGQVKRFLRSKFAKGLAHSTVTHIKNALGGIFNEALDDEVGTLMTIFQKERPLYYPLVLLLVSSGCRIGEAVALQWWDIDLEEREMLIRRNFVRNRIDDSPKNGKDRRVDMTTELADCLLSLKKDRVAEALKKGTGSIDTDWLFRGVKDNTQPLNYQTWRRDVFYPILEEAGLRKIRVHDLRHTYASIMISTGCTLVYLRDQLGHSSIKVTADVYGHLLKGNKEKPVDKLSSTM
jgi:integrase